MRRMFCYTFDAMTKILSTAEGFANAADMLAAGACVAVPTETVYGLAADAGNADAVAAIYEAKGRPSFNPLIVHVDGLEMAQRVGVLDETMEQLADIFWPGPLTMVVPLRDDAGLAPAVTAGLQTVALRHPVGALSDLASATGRPLAAPSANPSGRTSATTAQHVVDGLSGRIGLVLDGGPCPVGVESTIVKSVEGGIAILREGGLSADDLATVAPVVEHIAEAKVEAPGQLLAHYAPGVPIRMNAGEVAADEGLLAFGPDELSGAKATLNLSRTGDVAEAARNLFSVMQQLAASGVRAIAVQPIPQHGVGAAVNDRLTRAAAGADDNG